MNARPTRPAGRTKTEQFLPLGYFAAALALVVVLLPTVLRPPQTPPTQTSELSPDAPPDPNQQAIISSFQRGESGTPGEAGLTGEEPLAVPTTLPKQARVCPFGIGNPPRQTESIYAPPCAGAFKGDNGGATTKGVTPTEVRIGISPQTSGYRTSYDGEVDPTAQPGESAADRTWRVYQAYFNSRYQLYGRQLRFYSFRGAATGSTEDGRARAVALDEQGHVFAVVGNNGGMEQEAIRRKLVTWGTYHNDSDWYARNSPYAYSWHPEGDAVMRLTGEVLCKQLSGKNATFTSDVSLNNTKRKFGLIMFQDETHTGAREKLDAALAACGERLAEAVMYYPDTSNSSGTAGLATAMTRLRSQGVTTVVCMCDYFFAPTFMGAATGQSYFPEWYMPGFGNMDQNGKARAYPPDQWSHAFGMSYQEMGRPDQETDWYRAYKSIDPAGEPQRDIGEVQFFTLAQVVAGIQMAGPKLTPQTYRDGLLRLPHRSPEPIWSMAGGYAPNDLTFADYASFVWWDSTAPDPQQSGQTGAYRHMFGGKKFKVGEVPTDPIPFFEEGSVRPGG